MPEVDLLHEVENCQLPTLLEANLIEMQRLTIHTYVPLETTWKRSTCLLPAREPYAPYHYVCVQVACLYLVYYGHLTRSQTLSSPSWASAPILR